MELKFHDTEYQAEVADRLNSIADPVARRALTFCLDVPRWVAAIVDARPFDSDDAVRRAVFTVAKPFTSDEIARALLPHPRIGDRPEGDDEHAQSARHEQSGVDVSSADVVRALREGNEAYEKRFGRVFLVRAAGRDFSDILEVLGRRLLNDRDTEASVVDNELREIAVLRLGRAVSDV